MRSKVFPEGGYILKGLRSTHGSLRKNGKLCTFGLMAFFLSSFFDFSAVDKIPVKKRKILSVAVARVQSVNLVAKLVKIRTHRGIFVELYDSTLSHFQPKLGKIDLPFKHNAYFSFQDRAHDLFVFDSNKDGTSDFLMAGLDTHLQGHLVSIVYDKNIDSFVLVSK